MSVDERNTAQQPSSNHSIRAILGLEERGEALHSAVLKDQAEILEDDGESWFPS